MREQHRRGLAHYLNTALFTLQIGQMSSVLDSGLAFHIVRVLERKEAGRKPFIDVQGEIRDDLKEQLADSSMISMLSLTENGF